MYSPIQDLLVIQADQLHAELLAAHAEIARLRARLAETVVPMFPTFSLAQVLDWLGNRGIVTYRNGAAFELLAHYNGVLYARVKSPRDVEALAADPANCTENVLLTEHWDQYGTFFDSRNCTIRNSDDVCAVTTYATHTTGDDGRIKEIDVVECYRGMTRADFDAMAIPTQCLLVDNWPAPRNALC